MENFPASDEMPLDQGMRSIISALILPEAVIFSLRSACPSTTDSVATLLSQDVGEEHWDYSTLVCRQGIAWNPPMAQLEPCILPSPTHGLNASISNLTVFLKLFSLLFPAQDLVRIHCGR